MKEKDILFEKGGYWVTKSRYGFEVYKDGVTHAVCVARIGYKGERGLEMAKEEIERRRLNE